MRPGLKLAAFAVVLAVAFGAGTALGDAVGPVDLGGEAPDVVDEPREHTPPTDDRSH